MLWNFWITASIGGIHDATGEGNLERSSIEKRRFEAANEVLLSVIVSQEKEETRGFLDKICIRNPWGDPEL